MFVIGALPALVLVPLMLRYLPESTAFLQARADGVTPTAVTATPAPARAAKNPVGMLFHHGLARSTVAFWVTSFMGLLLVYGLNTWLPQIMREAGYELGAALALLLVLNVGAVLGLLVAGQVADKIGTRRSAIAWFSTAALFLALLSVKLPGIGVYLSVLLTGMFVFSAQVLVYAYIARVYPAAARGTALGGAAGIGRLGAITGPLITGVLLTAGMAYPWGFYLFALVAAVGAIAIFLVNRDPATDEPLPVTEDDADHVAPAHGGSAQVHGH
jgi:MFS family permease